MGEQGHKNRLVRFRELFEQLIELPQKEHKAFLDEHCAEDREMRRELLSLVLQTQSAGRKVDQVGEVAAADRETIEREITGEAECPGTQIGNYALVELLGEGGFGSVWMAQQSDPVRRKVALKIIKLGMDTREVVARFEAERQALAMMDHPNIATVFDAGATKTGRPYFVMELVQGIPITDYCNENQLALEDRLRLFIDVCHAVQHAHQAGVIHRDIKPSNILVSTKDGKPLPKIIDFGIAKATSKQLTDHTLVTQLHTFVGTPVYSSPEQMDTSGQYVDTRADIYSLGVVLYELLTGRVPFDPDTLARQGLEAMYRILRENDPPKPSTRLKTLSDGDRETMAKLLRTKSSVLSSSVKGDLDAIVMHCIEKNRARRYATANSLAEDLECFLDDKPISAHPPTKGYLIRKFLARHHRMVASFVAMALILVIGTVTSVWQAVKATRAGNVAWAVIFQDKAETNLEMENGPPALALTQIIASLERDDTPERRRIALTALWKAPVDFRLEAVNGHRPSKGVTFSSDGKSLVTCSDGPEVLIWPSDGGPPDVLSTGEDAFIPSVLRFSPSEKYLLVDYEKKDSGLFVGPFKQVLWDMGSRKPIKQWPVDQWAPQWFSDDETRLLAYSRELKTPYPGIGWWSIEDESIQSLGSPHEAPPPLIRFPMVQTIPFYYSPSKDLKWLVSWKENEVFVTPILKTSLGDPMLVGQHTDKIFSASINKDGTLISTSDEKTLKIWSPKRPGECLIELQSGLASGNFNVLDSQILAGWPDIIVLIISHDFRAPPGAHYTPFFPFENFPGQACQSPDKKWMVLTGDRARWSSIYNMEVVRPFHVQLNFEEINGINAVQLLPDLSKAAICNKDGQVFMVDLQNPTAKPDLIFQSPARLILVSLEHDPKGEFLLVGTHREKAWLIPLNAGPPVQLEEAPSYTFATAFSPNGDLIAVAGGAADMPVSEIYPRVMDRNGNVIARLGKYAEDNINDLEFLNDDELVIASDSVLFLWNFRTDSIRIINKGNHFIIDKSENYLLAVTENEVHLYDRHTFEKSVIPVSPRRAAKIAPNEKFLAIGDRSGAIHVQYLDQNRYHIIPKEYAASDVWIDPNGYWMITINGSGKLSYWPIPRGEPLHDRPLEEFLEILKGQTNVRVVLDPEEEGGYRYEVLPFPGWDNISTWQEWYSPEYMENIVWEPQLDLEALGIESN